VVPGYRFFSWTLNDAWARCFFLGDVGEIYLFLGDLEEGHSFLYDVEETQFFLGDVVGELLFLVFEEEEEDYTDVFVVRVKCCVHINKMNKNRA